MLKVNDRVKLLKDIIFDYGEIAKEGDIDLIYKIDNEGYWLKSKEIYIEHGFENEYLKLI